MERRGNVLWRRAAREALAALALAAGLAGCRDEVPAVRVERRLPAPAGVERVHALPGGELWLSRAGEVVLVDSLGAERRRVAVPGAAVEVLGADSARLVVARGGREVMVVRLDSGAVAARRRTERAAPAAADPRGRWVYTTHAWGSVLGLDGALVPRWGWPDAGARATALGVGVLGDRVYVGLDEGDERGPAVQVRDAFTGRALSWWEAPAAPRGLAPAPDPALLYLWDEDGVAALRHTREGLEQRWRVGGGTLGMDSVAAVRPSPAGDRVAVVGRRDGEGRLVILEAATGREASRWNGSPPDAAWDVRGRLVVPAGAELLWLRDRLSARPDR